MAQCEFRVGRRTAHMAGSIPSFTPVEYSTTNAYHGTKVPDARSIWESKKFKVSTGETRFGPGVYFWENSPQAAKKWVYVYHHTNEWAVIRASASIGKLLDLLTNEHWEAFEKIHGYLARERNMRIEDYTHASVLALLSAAKLIDGVRLVAAVSPKTQIHRGSKMAGPFDIILCIYDPLNIVVTAIDEHSNARPAA